MSDETVATSVPAEASVSEPKPQPVKEAEKDGVAKEKGGRVPLLATGRALRRHLDDGLDAEVEAALAEFDAGSVLTQGNAQPTPPPTQEPTGKRGGRGPKPSPEKKTVRVVAVRGPDVFVDLGERSEGLVPTLQFGDKVPAAGDLVELVVDHYDQNADCYVMRRPGVAQEADWGSVAKGMIVDAHIRKVNKGGLEVTVNGIRAFMPAGQADVDHIPDLNVLVGQVLRCEVTEVSLSSKNLIVSRRIVMEREREEKAKATLASLAEGQIIDGTVKRVTDFGAFVDIGGVDGLVHISQMSWQRVKHPSDLLAVGQPVRVTVLKFEREAKKISLGLRQLLENPWSRAEEKYFPGTIVKGRVTKIMDFGAFVELEPGIEGLIHVSELSPQRVRRVNDVVTIDQMVDVKVVSLEKETQRIGLSLKGALADQQAAEEKDLPEAPAEAPTAEGAKPKPKAKSTGPLKGGLGGGGGNLFG